MAASDARPIPLRNQAYRVTFPILDADGDLVTAATALDSEVSKDGGTFADCTSEAVEIATGSGMYYLDLTATEMDAATVAVIVKTTSSGAKTTPIVLYPDVASSTPTAAEIADAVWDELLAGHATAGSAGAALSAAGGGGGAPTAIAIADEILKRDWTAVSGEASRSVLNALRFLRNKWSITGGTLTVTKEDDTVTAWTATLTAAAGASPITGSDPA